MGKRSAKKKRVLSFFCRKLRSSKRTKFQPAVAPSQLRVAPETPSLQLGVKGGRKKAGSRLWMLLDRSGKSELSELDKNAIIQRVSIPARDLRILGPLFARSPRIIVRDKAMVVNLDFIKAIISADEVLVLDPLCNEVLPFVDQLRRRISLNSSSKFNLSGNIDELGMKMSTVAQSFHYENGEDEQVLPFELQVLDAALEFVCAHLVSNASELARNTYPVIDELTMNINTKNLDRVRCLKYDLTRLLSRVQKVRDEIMHLLDNNEDLSQFYLTRKRIQNQQFEALLASATSNSIVPATPNLAKLNSHGGKSSSVNSRSDDNNGEDLEMLLEAYFMQLEGSRSKILMERKYIDDTEDYVNIQLGNQRNELIQLQLVLGIFSFAMTVDSMIIGLYGMNIPSSLSNVNHIFVTFVAGTTGGSFLIFFALLAYARWKKLLGS